MYTLSVNTRRKPFTYSIVILLLSTSITVYSTTTESNKTTDTEINTKGPNPNVQAAISEIFKKDTFYDDVDVYVPFRSDSHDQFSWAFLKQILQEETDENVIVSPFSLQLILAILSEAAAKDTKTKNELMFTLSGIKSPDNIRGFYQKTLTSLKLKNPYHTLNLETKLYTDDFIEPQQRYHATLHRFYDTDIERLDFNQPTKAAKTINAWCQNVTHGRLEQIVTEENIRNSVLVMANVIYFNGLWRTQFNDTFDGAFFHTPTKQLKVNYMKQTDYFYYYDSNDLDAKILRLPYKGKKFSMFIVLPKSKSGINELIKSLENNKLKSIQWLMEEVKVIVTLPKFKFEYKKDMKRVLNELGIEDIFTDSASLPGLARGADVARKLKVSNIYQKAGIDVNEIGTEAFASTVVEISNKFGGSSTIEEFNVNRPFLFVIEEETSGNIIFAGKVINP